MALRHTVFRLGVLHVRWRIGLRADLLMAGFCAGYRNDLGDGERTNPGFRVCIGIEVAFMAKTEKGIGE